MPPAIGALGGQFDEIEGLSHLWRLEELADAVTHLGNNLASVAEMVDINALALILQYGSEDDRVSALEIAKRRFEEFRSR